MTRQALFVLLRDSDHLKAAPDVAEPKRVALTDVHVRIDPVRIRCLQCGIAGLEFIAISKVSERLMAATDKDWLIYPSGTVSLHQLSVGSSR